MVDADDGRISNLVGGAVWTARSIKTIRGELLEGIDAVLLLEEVP